MWLRVCVFLCALVVSQAGDFCAGRCGGRSLDGSCDCTEDCRKTGSCCWDFQYACFIAGNFSSNLKCQGRCGWPSLDETSCGCTEDCEKTGSCCWDFQITCNSTGIFDPDRQCQGRCGGPSLDGSCNCTENCGETKSCCWDVQMTCKATEVFSPDNPICALNATLPRNPGESCENRCGKRREANGGLYLDIFNAQINFEQCSCDVHCGYHGDCCYDFNQTCLQQFKEFQGLVKHYPITYNVSDFACLDWLPSLVIHTCPDGTECEFAQENYGNKNTFLPVYDVHRGIHFINVQCAVCNWATEVEPWDFKLRCNYHSGVNLTDSGDNYICKEEYSISAEKQRPCFYLSSDDYVVDFCDIRCRNPQLKSLCESGVQSPVQYKGRTYRNVYCSICHASLTEREIHPTNWTDYDRQNGTKDGIHLTNGTNSDRQNGTTDEIHLTNETDSDRQNGTKDEIHMTNGTDSDRQNGTKDEIHMTNVTDSDRQNGTKDEIHMTNVTDSDTQNGTTDEIHPTNVTDSDTQNGTTDQIHPTNVTDSDAQNGTKDEIHPTNVTDSDTQNGTTDEIHPTNVTDSDTQNGTKDGIHLTNVTDSDAQNGTKVTKYPPPECAAGEVYVPDEDECQPVKCPLGFVLNGSNCIPEASNITLTNSTDSNQENSSKFTRHPPLECAAGEIYVPDEDSCQPVTCPPGFVLDGSDCIPEPSNITFTVSGRLSHVSLVFTMSNKTELEKLISQEVENVINKNNVTYHLLNVTTEISVANDNVSVVVQIQCDCDYKGWGNINVPNFLIAMDMEVRFAVVGHLLHNIQLHSFDQQNSSEVTTYPPPECAAGEVYVPDEDSCQPVTCPLGFVLNGSDCIPEASNITLTNVTDSDRQNGSKVTKQPPLECSVGEVYVPDENACQPIICESGFVLDGSDCIPEVSNITLTVSGKLSHVSLVFTMRNKNELEKRILQTVKRVMNKNNVTYHHMNVTTRVSISDDNVAVRIRIQCNCDYKGRGNSIFNFPNFLIAMETEVRDAVVDYSLRNNVRLHSIHTTRTFV